MSNKIHVKAGDPGDDLWDRPPRPARRCLGCNEMAEPYAAGRCWFCVVTGQTVPGAGPVTRHPADDNRYFYDPTPSGD